MNPSLCVAVSLRFCQMHDKSLTSISFRQETHAVTGAGSAASVQRLLAQALFW